MEEEENRTIALKKAIDEGVKSGIADDFNSSTVVATKISQKNTAFGKRLIYLLWSNLKLLPR